MVSLGVRTRMCPGSASPPMIGVPGRKIAPAARAAFSSGANQPFGFHDSRFRRKKGGDGADGRFAPRNEGAIDDFEAFHSVCNSARAQRFELRRFCFFRRDDQLAAAGMRDPIQTAELVKHRPAFDAQACLECAGRVVNPGVNDPAVVRAGFDPRPGVALEDTNREPARGDEVTARQPGDAGADDGDVDFFHVRYRRAIVTRSHTALRACRTVSFEPATAVQVSSGSS